MSNPIEPARLVQLMDEAVAHVRVQPDALTAIHRGVRRRRRAARVTAAAVAVAVAVTGGGVAYGLAHGGTRATPPATHPSSVLPSPVRPTPSPALPSPRHHASHTQSPPRPARAGTGATASVNEQLLHVSASSARNAWALGRTQTTPSTSVVLHWNGTAWSRVAIPNPTVNSVVGVSAVSATNAWLVGVHCSNGCATQTTLILHWNGTAWSRVASPNVAGKINFLSAVGASSAGNAWAVGSACTVATGTCVPLMLRWNGSTWSKVASPAAEGSSTLSAVTTISASDAWAAGSVGTFQPLMMHWNGTKWSLAAIPQVGAGALSGLAASSASDVWAVGDTRTVTGSLKTLIFHWNGTAWSKVASPDPGGGGALSGAAATSASNAWAAGQACATSSCSSSSTLIVHWNGTAWSRVASPNPGPGSISMLADVAATSASNAWAVGSNCTIRETQCVPIILHWNGTSWTRS